MHLQIYHATSQMACADFTGVRRFGEPARREPGVDYRAMQPPRPPLDPPIHAAEPARVGLAQRPTPGHWLRQRWGGLPIWLKRDDHTGGELSGNKIRKLEYLLADAQAQGATYVLTCGGEQSNHARATVLAAARLGMRSALALRTANPAAPPAPTGNILLDRLCGAEVRWISHAQWRDRAAILEEEAARLRARSERPYVIPEGGSNALGTWGYIRAAFELAADLDAASVPRPLTVVYACGSGGTGAGLVVGAKLAGFAERGIKVAGVNVCDDRAYFVDKIGEICAEVEARWSLGANVTPADIDIVDGHVGLGYAKSRPEELATLRRVCRDEGVVLDPVYSGKAFHGMVTELGRDPERFGKAVCFVHTGGLFGLLGLGVDGTAALLAE
ncbi:MAG: D-cysteine desulfhydrase family protein [Kofleriaceae bacterium]